MPTSGDMITTAFVDAGIRDPGETIPSEDSAYGLAKLNSMLDSASINRLLIYQLLQESKALTSSVGSYTIGSGGAFNTTRPTKIVDPSFIRDSGNSDYPLEIIEAPQYGAVRFKSSDGAIPSYLFYDNADVAGLGTIYLYPEPGISLTLYINSWKHLQSFASLTTDLVMPPGYQLYIESNLAVALCPTYGKRVNPDLKQTAKEAKAAVEGFNAPAGALGMPAMPGIRRRSSILTG